MSYIILAFVVLLVRTIFTGKLRFYLVINEACIGYFGIRDIGPFLGILGYLCFLFWDMGYSGI